MSINERDQLKQRAAKSCHDTQQTLVAQASSGGDIPAELRERILNIVNYEGWQGQIFRDLQAALTCTASSERDIPDVENLLDNAACASQVRELLRDDEGEETVLREAVRMNVVEPLLKVIRSANVAPSVCPDTKEPCAEFCDQSNGDQCARTNEQISSMTDAEKATYWFDLYLEETTKRRALERQATQSEKALHGIRCAYEIAELPTPCHCYNERDKELCPRREKCAEVRALVTASTRSEK